MPITKDRDKRQSIIHACLRMNALGINQGTSGNISQRHDDGMVITPTSTPYEAMKPNQIVYMHLDGNRDPSAWSDTATRRSESIAFSSEVDTGSREENASKQRI